MRYKFTKEDCRKGGKRRAEQFTPEHQSKAARALHTKRPELAATAGSKGYYRSMQIAGFAGTTYMKHAASKYDEPPF